MPRSQGQVLERDCKSGRRYALRFVAYGHRRYATLGGAEEGWNRERARVELARILGEVARGDWTPPPRNLPFRPASSATSKTTFGVFARRWLKARQAEVAASTHAYERWAVELHLLPYFANVPFARVSIRSVDAYRHYKLQEAARRRVAIAANRPELDRCGQPRRPMSPASINKTIDVLQAILELAHEYELIASNPARGRRRRLKATPRPAIYLDRLDHIEALLQAAAGLDHSPRWLSDDRHAILATFILAGLRVDELCHLRWDDVDLEHHRIRVSHSKTPAGCREITVLPLLHRVLTTHQARAKSALIFPTRTGTPHQPANLRNHTLAHAARRADELLKTTGRPPLPADLTPHCLRHTFASILVSRGEDPASVMAQLGHTDAHFTLRVYAHQMRRSPDERRRLQHYVNDHAASVTATR